MRAIIVDRVSPKLKEVLEKYGVEVDVEILPGHDRLQAIIANYDLLIMRVDPAIDRQIMDAAQGRLKMIAVCSVGTNHIDMEYAEKLNIVVKNAPGLSNNAVAELTISKMLDVCRHTMAANREVKSDQTWNKYHFMGHELRGHTLGILGLGRIGARVCEIANAFEMRVVTYDPYLDEETCIARGAQKLELQELLEVVDILSIHLPLTAETKDMISYQEIEKMKDGSIIVNMARGGVLNEQAAAEALRNGKLAGIGIDVVANELSLNGLSDDAKCASPLIDEDACIVSPHIGACTYEAMDAIGEYMIGEIGRVFQLNMN